MKKALCLVLAVFLVGCSGKPSNSAIESKVVEYFESQLAGDSFYIENFKKSNGFKKDKMNYIVEANYDVIYTKSLYDMANDLMIKYGNDKIAEMQIKLAIMNLKNQLGNFEAGHRVSTSGEFHFIKKENGWEISS